MLNLLQWITIIMQQAISDVSGYVCAGKRFEDNAIVEYRQISSYCFIPSCFYQG
jgi:hypothetical protein